MNLNITKKNILILFIISAIIIISFVLKTLQAANMDFSSYHILQDPDSWYTFRQIEVMVAHFPQYNWFDPMTAYPVGKVIEWGPVFPALAAIGSILTGADQRSAIMSISAWLPVILGLIMIPVVYALGRLMNDWKTGLIAALFIGIVSGEYFYRTSFGVVDHHIGEVLFTTLFSLFYVIILIRSSETEVVLTNPSTFLPLILPSLIAGVFLGAGILTAPTCILFFLIVAIYTILQYSWNIFHKRATTYLFIANSIIGVVTVILLALNGTPSSAPLIMAFSLTQILFIVLFIVGTVILQILSMFLSEKPHVFVVSVLGLIAAGVAVLFLTNPDLIISLMPYSLAGYSSVNEWTSISELKPWSLGKMWTSFNIGIILAVIGLVLISYQFMRESRPEKLYIPVWSAVILLLTLLQVRWEYYSAVVIALLSGFTLGAAFLLDKPGSSPVSRLKPDKGPVRSKKKKTDQSGPRKETSAILTRLEGTGTSIVVVCVILFVGISVLYDTALVRSEQTDLVPPQWAGTLVWMSRETPDPGVSYLGPYPTEGWHYPAGSYGVLSWWDYGHWITYIAKRIPITNPFQDNVGAAAAFFLSESEDKANTIAGPYNLRYIITDWKMTNAKFPAMMQWYDKSLLTGYYSREFKVNSSRAVGGISTLTLIGSPYYSTMISRLHNFDGSSTAPDKVAYIEFEPGRTNDTPAVLAYYEILDSGSARERLAAFMEKHPAGKEAAIMGVFIDSPVENVTALRNYRLIYEESGSRADGSPDPETSVKVFERVKGARLPGKGTIEVPVIANDGRTFTYRQESEAGLFILPYSTQGSTSPVKAIGPYRVLETGRTFDVSENDVLSGNTLPVP